MKHYFFPLFFSFFVHSIHAQECTLTLSGTVLDQHEGKALSDAVLLLKKKNVYFTTDSLGRFEVQGLCAGQYHLQVSHVGCTTVQYVFTLKNDTQWVVQMNHYIEQLDDVQIVGNGWQKKVKLPDRLQQQELQQWAHKNFSEVLNELPGINILRTGSGISKPIIQGLYGNRIAIVNQGTVLSGQQWGNDHAPEIDAFMADQVQVLKGVSALRYGGGNLGSVVQLLPKEFASYPNTQGKIKYNYASNGRGHVVHARVENSNPWLNARLYATYKNAGDLHTPIYYLTNTGRREANVSVQLNKNWNKKSLNDFNYSLFTSEIGLLRGSHIGNLTDLQTALKQSIPFFTEDEFNRNIRQPSQKVQHHQAAYDGRYVLNAKNMLQFKSSWQWNIRQEFDVRRGGRSEMPALSLSQHTFWNEVAHTYTTQQMEWSSGIQYQFVNNTNVPETGILPLIPDYFQSYTAAYSTLKFNQNKWQYEAGLRGGVTQYEAFTITQTLPREVLVVPLQYGHAAASAQASYLLSGNQTLTFQTGFTQRPPEIHELFSFGLHQGISSIEEGDASLKPEYSWKSSFQWELRPSNRVYVSALLFYQRVADFIYLQPQADFRLTIRGAFPVFMYQQQDAQILGSELYLKALITDHLELIASYSSVRGRNTGLDVPLVYMPSDVVRASISYEWSRLGQFKQPKLQLSGRYVAEQTRLLESQDFVAPPPAYFLLHLQASTDFIGRFKAWNVHLRAENLLNTVYRDYLNRQRYFADEMGINIMLGFTYSF